MWTYKGDVVVHIDDQFKSFVYMITNTITGRKYIGLKTITTPKYKVVKGVRKKNGTKETDWRNYWSSSLELQADVENLGQDKFTREILYYCKMKAHSNYLEAKLQMDLRVLEHPELYYNRIINVRINANHIKSLKIETE